jgi:tetratricopeptide (TPR) repeat protein
MLHSAKFLNRNREIRRLRDELKSTAANNKIVMVHGRTAVGKSALTRKLTEEQSERLPVRVPIMATRHPDGHFFGRLAQELHRAEKARHGMTLERYVREIPGGDVRNWYYSLLIGATSGGTVASSASKLLQIEFERLTNSGTFSPDHIFLSADTDTMPMLSSYVSYLFSEHRYAIAVENVQVIDERSAVWLSNLLTVPASQFLLFEYTDEADLAISMREVEAFFENACDLSRMSVERLSWDDLRPYLAASTIESIARKVYVVHGGNLRQLQDLEFLLAEDDTDSTETFESPTAERLRRLSKTQKFALAMIVAHSGAVHPESLDALYQYMPALRDDFHDLIADAEALQDEFVKRDGGRWIVAHDSIAAAVNTGDTYERYLRLSYEAWSRYYAAEYQRRNFTLISENEMLSLLFHFHLHSDISRIYLILPDVERVATTSIAPQSAMNFLRQLLGRLEATSVDEATMDRVRFTLLDIAYAVGLYTEAASLLAQINADSERRRVYEVALLYRRDLNEDAIALALRYLDRPHVAGSSYELSLKLLLMAAFRSANRFRECDRMFEEIEATAAYNTLPEYGYFLRNAEIVVDLDESIEYIERSIDFFHARKMDVAEAHSRISLAMELILKGDLDGAEEQHAVIAALMSGKTNERHIVFNNQALVRIYRGPSEYEHALELLSQARATANTPFETISLYTNLFVVYAMSKNYNAADGAAARIEQLLKSEPDRVLHRTAYYNFAMYARQRGLETEARRYLALARDAVGVQGDYWRYRLEDEPFTGPRPMRASIPYDLAFLSYWHFPVSHELRH